MGRYHKRKKSYNHNRFASTSQHGEGDTTVGINSSFSPAALDQLKEYLMAYKTGCERVCFNDDDVTLNNTTLSDADVLIGDQLFPPLTDEILTRPFLSIPSSLSSKQRRDVHKLCVDIDLYHCGIGTPRSEHRHIAVSIHCDGINRHPEIQTSRDTIGSMRQCKPWFYRSHCTGNVDGDTTPTASNSSVSSFVEETTKKARADIEALIDQPGKCIRNAQDSINFPGLENFNLEHIPPPAHGDGTWVLVNSAQAMKDCSQEMINAMPSAIAFDMEMWNVDKYTQVTCLIQITSDAGKEYVIDPLADGVWENVALLAPLFSDPSIVKIGHAIGGLDVKSLHRDFGIFVLNAFDTYEAAQVLHMKHAGLAAVCRHYGLLHSETYFALKDEYQTTDWRQRPLTEPMIRYGRYDIHYLIALRTLMIRDLVRKELWDNFENKLEIQNVAKALSATLRSIQQVEGDVDSDNGGFKSVASTASDDAGYYTAEESDIGDIRKPEVSAKELRMQPNLMKVITTSQRRCLDLWSNLEEPYEKNAVLRNLMKRSAEEDDIQYDDTNLRLLERLVSWRRRVSRKEQCLPRLICSLDLLIHISWKQPTIEAELRRIAYLLPEFLEGKNNLILNELLDIVTDHVSRYSVVIESNGTKEKFSSRFGNSDGDEEGASKRRRLVYCALTVTLVAALAGMSLTRRRK